MKECYLYEQLADNKVRCNTCARRCLIPEGSLGFCRVRKNEKGRLYALNYSKLCATNVDPISKKPLMHFNPGSSVFSIATIGCNFRCRYCLSGDTMVIVNYDVTNFEDLFNNHSTSSGDDHVHFTNGDLFTLNYMGRETRILKVFSHRYSGHMITIKPYYLPEIKVTPYHELVIYDRELNKIRKVRACELRKDRHYLICPIPSYREDGEGYINVKGTLSKYATKFKVRVKYGKRCVEKLLQLRSNNVPYRRISEVLGIPYAYCRNLYSKVKKNEALPNLGYAANSLVEESSRVRFKTEKRPGIPAKINADEKLAELLGYYCAEGCVVKCKDRINSYITYFSFGKNEEDLAKRVHRLIREVFGVTAKILRTATSIRVSSHKASLSLLFQELVGKNSSSKRVPSFILAASDRNVKVAFLRALLKEDGYITKDYPQSITVSKKLAFQIAFLFLQLGLMPSISSLKPRSGKINGRTARGKQSIFWIRIHDKKTVEEFLKGSVELNSAGKFHKFIRLENLFLVPIARLSTEKFDGNVYNLEVDDDSHTYLANLIGIGNCDNWMISQETEIIGREMPPETIVKKAKEYDCGGISYTYTEPTIFFEICYDAGKLAHEEGLFNTWVTNGYASPEAIRTIAPYLDAATVDFKGAGNPEFYRKLAAVPTVGPIYECLKEMRKQNIYIEVTNLVIPKYGDSLNDIRELASWIRDNLGKDTVFHLLRFHPDYELTDVPYTPVKTLEKAREVAMDYLNYVLIGNVPGHPGENTYCPNCKQVAIGRFSFDIIKWNLDEENRCKSCGTKVPIVGRYWREGSRYPFSVI